MTLSIVNFFSSHQINKFVKKIILNNFMQKFCNKNILKITSVYGNEYFFKQFFLNQYFSNSRPFAHFFLKSLITALLKFEPLNSS